MLRSPGPSYIDILAAALGAGDGPHEFLAEPSRWHRFVFEAKKARPNLFAKVTFDISGGESRPWSDEAEHALHVLTQSQVLRVPNYTYAKLDLPDGPAARARVAGASQEIADAVKDIAEIANKVLRAN